MQFTYNVLEARGASDEKKKAMNFDQSNTVKLVIRKCKTKTGLYNVNTARPRILFLDLHISFFVFDVTQCFNTEKCTKIKKNKHIELQWQKIMIKIYKQAGNVIFFKISLFFVVKDCSQTLCDKIYLVSHVRYFYFLFLFSFHFLLKSVHLLVMKTSNTSTLSSPR